MSGQHANHSLGRQRAVAEADFRLVTGFHVNLPLKPFRFLIGQLDARQRNHLRDIARAGDTTAPIDRSNFHNQRIAVTEIAERLAVIMNTPDRGCPNANGVDTAVRDAALPIQRQESDVSTAIMAAVQIGVGRLGHKTKAAGLEQLRQTFGVIALEIEWRSLRVFFGDRSRAKLRGPTNGLLGGGEIVVHQTPGRHQPGAVVVKSMNLDLLGKILSRIPDADIEPKQIANRLAIFPRVKTTQHTVTARRIQFRPGGSELSRQVSNHRRAFRNRWLRFVLRRHVPEIQLIDNLLIALQIIELFNRRRQRVKPTVRLLFVVTVTTDAVLLEKGVRPFIGSNACAKRQQQQGMDNRFHGRPYPIFIGENVPVLRPNRLASEPNQCSTESQRLASGTRWCGSEGQTK